MKYRDLKPGNIMYALDGYYALIIKSEVQDDGKLKFVWMTGRSMVNTPIDVLNYDDSLSQEMMVV
jgi:hypothetical protein